MASSTIYLSNSAKASDGGWLEGKIYWSSTPNNDANISSITATIYVRKASSIQLTQSTSGRWGYSLTVNGSTVSGTSSSLTVLTDWVQVASKTVSVDHAKDGSKTITISGYVTGPSTSKYSGLKTSGSGPATLDTIPRAATIDKITNSSGTTISSINTGNTIRVYWTPRSASHKYEIFIDGVMYPPAGQGYYTVSSIAQTYREFTIAHSDLPTSTSKTVNIQLKTYNSSTSQIGNLYTKTLTISVPSNIQPSIGSFAASIVDGLTSGSNIYYVQGKSKCKLSMSFTPGSGSSIKQYSISGPNLSGASGTPASATSFSATTSVLTQSGTLYYNASVSDKRNRSYTINNSTNASRRVSIYVYPYAAPIIKIASVRTTISGTVEVSYNITYSSINGANQLGELKIYRKLSNDSLWPSTPVATSTLGTTASGSVLINGCDSTKSYDFKATVADTAYNSSGESNISSVSTEFRIVNIGPAGNSIAIGKLAELNNTFECALNADFDGNISIQGNTLADFVIEQGIQDGWVYKKWNSGIVECWKEYRFKPDNTGTVYSSIAYPFTFTGINPIVTLTRGNNATVCGDVYNSNTSGSRDNIFTYCDVTVTDITTTDYYIGINISVLAQWK